jgi:hypothetical protein
VNEYLAGEEVRNYFNLTDYTYLEPLAYCPQGYSSHAEQEEEKKRCPALRGFGFCLTWSLLYALVRLSNPRWSREDVLKEMMKTGYEQTRNQKIRRFQSLVDMLLEGKLAPST